MARDPTYEPTKTYDLIHPVIPTGARSAEWRDLCRTVLRDLGWRSHDSQPALLAQDGDPTTRSLRCSLRMEIAEGYLHFLLMAATMDFRAAVVVFWLIPTP